MNLKVISRKSKLSLLQVKEVFSHFSDIEYQLTAEESTGDKNKQISLMDKTVPSDFFTHELDFALINNQVDIAIHSAKDLPYPLPHPLELISLLEAFDQTDSLVSKGNLTLSQLPKGSKIGTSSINRKNELLKYRSDFQIISIRGTIEERIAQVDNGTIDALIVATCALTRLGMEERIAERLSFKTHPLQGNLAIVAKRNKPKLKSLFESKDIRKKYGKVTLVGFGPGNPGLLTIAGDKALNQADIIFYDDLLDINFLDKYSAEKVYVGKRKNKHSFHQEEINEIVYQSAIVGKNAVRLKGGDPMIFAHGREEIDFLKSRFIEIEVIPGITSAIALSAATQIPLTHRGIASSVAFITGHSTSELQIPNADTLVYYMGGSNASPIAKAIIDTGRNGDTPVALVHNVSLPDQQTFFSTLKELKNSHFKYPTPILIVIGNVVSFESHSYKQNVLVTGTSREEYSHLGNITHTPLIKIKKADNNKNLYKALGKLDNFDWIIFTSRYGVYYFFESLRDQKKDIRSLAKSKIASVGKTTSDELSKYHIRPDLESETESAQGLIDYFTQNNITQQNILLPRSDKGLKYLSVKLETLGNHITDIPVYQNIENKEAEKVDLRQFDKIVFSSPSAIDAFVSIYGEIPREMEFIARGETTKKALKSKIG